MLQGVRRNRWCLLPGMEPVRQPARLHQKSVYPTVGFINFWRHYLKTLKKIIVVFRIRRHILGTSICWFVRIPKEGRIKSILRSRKPNQLSTTLSSIALGNRRHSVIVPNYQRELFDSLARKIFEIFCIKGDQFRNSLATALQWVIGTIAQLLVEFS